MNEVYRKFHNEQIREEEIFDTEEKKYIGHFIMDLCTELFELSDFRLVELSYQKDCWEPKFNIDVKFHNQMMNKDQIINEFVREV